MSFMDDFDPSSGDALGDQHLAAFPDARTLIAELEAEAGRADREYRVARVPETDVYVLYGVEHAIQVVRVISIRTYRGSTN